MQLTIPTFAIPPARRPKPHGYSIDVDLARQFADVCREHGRKQTIVLEALMRSYIASAAPSTNAAVDPTE